MYKNCSKPVNFKRKNKGTATPKRETLFAIPKIDEKP